MFETLKKILFIFHTKKNIDLINENLNFNYHFSSTNFFFGFVNVHFVLSFIAKSDHLWLPIAHSLHFHDFRVHNFDNNHNQMMPEFVLILD